jgi:hypothetical protein
VIGATAAWTDGNKANEGESKDPSGSSGRKTVSINGQYVLMEKALEPRRPLRSLSKIGGGTGLD